MTDNNTGSSHNNSAPALGRANEQGTALHPDRDETVADTDDPTRALKITKMFNIFTENPDVLPYNPDWVAENVVDELDKVLRDTTPREMADLAQKSAGVSFQESVIRQTEIVIRNKYVKTDVPVLIHLMNEHAKALEQPVENQDYTADSGTVRREIRRNQTFILISSLVIRTERAMKHLRSATRTGLARTRSHAESLFNLGGSE
jgi:hypothetical protein